MMSFADKRGEGYSGFPDDIVRCADESQLAVEAGQDIRDGLHQCAVLFHALAELLLQYFSSADVRNHCEGTGKAVRLILQ